MLLRRIQSEPKKLGWYQIIPIATFAIAATTRGQIVTTVMRISYSAERGGRALSVHRNQISFLLVPQIPNVRRNIRRLAFERRVMKVNVRQRICFQHSPPLRIRIFRWVGNNYVEADYRNAKFARRTFNV